MEKDEKNESYEDLCFIEYKEKLKNLNVVQKYVKNQPDGLNKSKKVLVQIEIFFTEFTKLTNQYNNDVKNLTKQLIPESKSLESKYMISLQKSITYYMKILQDFSKTIIDEINLNQKNKKKNESKMNEAYKNLFSIYNKEFEKILKSYRLYIRDNKKLEDILIENEVNKKTKDDDSKINKEDNTNNTNTINNNIDSDINNVNNEKKEKLIDDIEQDKILASLCDSISLKEKAYKEQINNSNIKLIKSLELGTQEIILIKDEIEKNCNFFVDKALEAIEHFKDKLQEIKKNFEDLNIESINSMKEMHEELKPEMYKLSCINNLTNNPIILKFNRLNKLNIIKYYKEHNISLSDEDLQQENLFVKKEDILRITKIMFKEPEKYSETEKKKLFSYFDESKELQRIFLSTLNTNRSSGHSLSDKRSLEYLGECFRYLNELILTRKDLDLFKYIFIMSMTYFYTENDKTYYLYKYISEHPSFKKEKFWEEYLDTLVEYDFNNLVYKENKPKKKISEDLENPKEKKKQDNDEFRITTSVFSNLITITKNMVDMELSHNFIQNFITRISKTKYRLTDDKTESILLILEENFQEKKLLMQEDNADSKVNETNNPENIINEQNQIINKNEKDNNNNNDDINYTRNNTK